MADDLSEEDEERWCARQRDDVLAYLSGEGFVAPTVGEWPAWHIAPKVAIWAVESRKRPGCVGWWVVSGDLPADYATCREERHPRQALRDIGLRWRDAAARWSNGERSDDIELSCQESEKELAPLLAARAKLFLDFAADDEIWEE